MTASEQMKKVLKYLNINAKAFSEMIGYKRPQIIYDIINMRTKRISEPLAIKINSVFPEISKTWLLAGEGEMIKSNTGQDFDDKPQEDVHGTVVPLLPILAHGGKLTDFECSISRYECEKVISPIDGVDLAITISGDSMAPEYPSGSSVLIKKVNEKAFIEWGKVYVLDTCNGTIIKQLMPHDNPSYVKCVSLNSAYPPFDLSLSYVHAIYRVLLCMAMK